MLIKTAELKELDDFKDIDEKTLERKMTAIEKAIRVHTHNNFQVREIRFKGSSLDNVINGVHPFIKTGDTIQISQSVNDGLYVVDKATDKTVKVDGELYNTGQNICTLVRYPEDIVEGAIKLLKWEIRQENENKDGVVSESETLSRHSTSVSYEQLNDTNTVNGYPIRLFGFTKPYVKARF